MPSVTAYIDFEYCSDFYPSDNEAIDFPNIPTIHVLIEYLRRTTTISANKTYMFLRPNGVLIENDNQLEESIRQQEVLHAIVRAE